MTLCHFPVNKGGGKNSFQFARLSSKLDTFPTGFLSPSDREIPKNRHENQPEACPIIASTVQRRQTGCAAWLWHGSKMSWVSPHRHSKEPIGLPMPACARNGYYKMILDRRTRMIAPQRSRLSSASRIGKWPSSTSKIPPPHHGKNTTDAFPE